MLRPQAPASDVLSSSDIRACAADSSAHARAQEYSPPPLALVTTAASATRYGAWARYVPPHTAGEPADRPPVARAPAPPALARPDLLRRSAPWPPPPPPRAGRRPPGGLPPACRRPDSAPGRPAAAR